MSGPNVTDSPEALPVVACSTLLARSFVSSLYSCKLMDATQICCGWTHGRKNVMPENTMATCLWWHIRHANCGAILRQ